jgi:hypothetical protein
VRSTYELSQLAALERRLVAATFERPVLLFSGGKDSVVLLHTVRRVGEMAARRPAGNGGAAGIPELSGERRLVLLAHGSGPRQSAGDEVGALDRVHAGAVVAQRRVAVAAHGQQPGVRQPA